MKLITRNEYLNALKIVKTYVNQVNNELKGIEHFIKPKEIKIDFTTFSKFIDRYKQTANNIDKGNMSRLQRVLYQSSENFEYVNDVDEYSFKNMRMGGKKTFEQLEKLKKEFIKSQTNKKLTHLTIGVDDLIVESKNNSSENKVAKAINFHMKNKYPGKVPNISFDGVNGALNLSLEKTFGFKLNKEELNKVHSEVKSQAKINLKSNNQID